MNYKILSYLLYFHIFLLEINIEIYKNYPVDQVYYICKSLVRHCRILYCQTIETLKFNRCQNVARNFITVRNSS